MKDLYRKALLNEKGEPIPPRIQELTALFTRKGRPTITIAKVSHIPRITRSQ